jgi:hypothetical protein
LWAPLAATLAASAGSVGCKGNDVPAASIGGKELELGKLDEGSFAELAFVPADAEAVLRVDLAALAARDPESETMLDFLLQAQQPNAWRFLRDAGVRLGRELSAVYLVVGAGGADHPAILLAGVGEIDAARARVVFAGAGGTVEQLPGDVTMYSWTAEQVAKGVHSHVPRGPGARGEAQALGVAQGLLILGPPALVRASLVRRHERGADVRRGPLADEMRHLAARATAWGVARRDARGVLGQLAAGLDRGRFHLTMSAHGKGALELRAEFASADAASTFAAQLKSAMAAGALLARKTPVGETLAALRDTPIAVTGKAVAVSTTF